MGEIGNKRRGQELVEKVGRLEGAHPCTHIESILDKPEVVIALFRDADAFLNV